MNGLDPLGLSGNHTFWKSFAMKSVLLALVVALPAVAAQTVYTAAELAKLPDRRSQLVWTRGMSSSLADPPCKTAADCGGKHMKQPECVEQTGGA